MKFFTKKGFLQKIAIVLVILVLFNFFYPNYAHAGVIDSVLVSPVIGLITFLCDGVIGLMQSNLYGISKSIIPIDNGLAWWQWALIFVGTVTATVGGFVLSPITLAGTTIAAISIAAGGAVTGGTYIISNAISEDIIPEDFELPNFRISPFAIFSGDIPLLDVDFINADPDEEITGENGQTLVSSAQILKSTVANWYSALRNLVLVGLMVILVYIGIRIIISSTAQEKSKYKTMIKDWLVAMCIVIFMHYIMSIALSVTGQLTKILNKENFGTTLIIPENLVKDDLPEEFEEWIQDGYLYWPTNYLGKARFNLQLEGEAKDEDGNVTAIYGTETKISYTIVYAVLTIYTVMFVFIYLKRVIYMAFLTIIAPLVALTYPIDKLKDGQAQAFDMWMKEYIYNLLIQPFHLILYTVLVGTAFSLIEEHMVYALVAIGFLLPAEKLLRNFFGFEKSGTLGSIMGGALGGAAVMQGINSIGKRLSGGTKKLGNGAAEKSTDKNSVRTMDSNRSTSDLFKGSTFGSSLNGSLPGGGQSSANQPTNTNTGGNSSSTNNMQDDENGIETLMGLQEQQAMENFANDYEAGNIQGPLTAEQQQWLNQRHQQQTQVPTTNNPVQSSNVNISSSPKPKRTIRGAAGKTAAKYVGKGLKSVAKRAPRAVLKGYGAATLGLAGVAAGLASDDYSNVFKYGAAGGAIGYAAGSTVASKASNTINSAKDLASNVKEDYYKNRYGIDYEDVLNIKKDDKFVKDKKAQKLYKKQLGIKDEQKLKEVMEAARKYREYGITDDETIIKAMRLQDYGEIDSKERILLAKLASQTSSEKDIESHAKRLSETVTDAAAIEKFKNGLRDITDK